MMALRQTQTILDQIVIRKQQRIAARRARISSEQLRETYQAAQSAGKLPVILDFASNLRQPKSLGVIAEIKKASPSKGIIQPDFQPAEQAAAYCAAGIQAISVLTEEDFFLGSDDDLRAARSVMPLPLLRKDFIIEPGQIYESRLLGASAILLICAILDDHDLGDFLNLAQSCGLTALVEIHDLTELMRALAAGAKVIGINNRDLHSFHIDLATTERLAGLIPADRTIIAESGIVSARDMARVYRAGAHAVLIGETLMRAAGSPESVHFKLLDLFGELPQ